MKRLLLLCTIIGRCMRVAAGCLGLAERDENRKEGTREEAWKEGRKAERKDGYSERHLEVVKRGI